MSWSERLSAVDAMFLDIEEPSAHMHVGGVLVFAGRPPAQDELVAHVSSRLDRVHRYRQRLASVPLHLGRPVWVDDASLDVADHVRRIVLPPPGGERALAALTARLLSEPLDRARPLWRLDAVEGVGPDRWALVSKTHHCLYDGIGGMDFLAAITDEDPRAEAPGPPPSWSPRPAPGAVERAGDALREAVARPLRLVAEALTGRGGRRVLRALAAGARPLATLAVSWPAPRWALDQRIGPERAWEAIALDLAAAKEVRAALGGTLNHVLLAVVAGALRRMLAARGAPVPEEIRVFVPVNVRPAAARGTYGNRLALVLCPVPVAEPDPVERLRRISAAAQRLEERREAAGILAFEELGELTPAPVAAEVIQLVLGMHFFNLVVSNIPGPRAPRFLLARRLLACHPVIPLAPGQGLSIGLLSYAGALDVGLLGAADRAGDLAVLSRALPDALEELVSEARGRSACRTGSSISTGPSTTPTSGARAGPSCSSTASAART